MNTDENYWYVLRTKHYKEKLVGNYLNNNGLTSFVPMHIIDKPIKGKDECKRVMVPIVHSYVFFQKTKLESEIKEILNGCTYPISLMRTKGDNPKICIIQNKEMQEFRYLCDPEINNQIYTNSKIIGAKEGKDVTLEKGPFAGIKGKLYRRKNKYYLIKTIIGISIVLQVPRWYCKIE